MGEKLLTGVVTTEWERRYPTIYELRPTPNMDVWYLTYVLAAVFKGLCTV
jgi:Ni,Fe-hydrogenase III small subunit